MGHKMGNEMGRKMGHKMERKVERMVERKNVTGGKMKILFVATVDLHIQTFHLRTIHELSKQGSDKLEH